MDMTDLDASLEISLGIASVNASMSDDTRCDSILNLRHGMTHGYVVQLASALNTSYGLDFSHLSSLSADTTLDKSTISEYDHMIAVAVKHGDALLGGDDALLAAPLVLDKHFDEYKGYLPTQIYSLYTTAAVIAFTNNDILYSIPSDTLDHQLTETQISAVSSAESSGNDIESLRALTYDFIVEHYQPSTAATSQSEQSS